MPDPKRILLTGSSGFVGTHVLAACEGGVFGEEADFVCPPPGWDLRDAQAVQSWVRGTAPSAVIHLAAQSFVPRSFEAPGETLDINLGGTLNLLQALSSTGFRGRLLYVSSGDIYGSVPADALHLSRGAAA